MRWINGETWDHKRARLESWHDWFAWYPVKAGITENGHWVKVWLVTVERKGIIRYDWQGGNIWCWTYREKAK